MTLAAEPRMDRLFDGHGETSEDEQLDLQQAIDLDREAVLKALDNGTYDPRFASFPPGF